MIEVIRPESRTEWLEVRKQGIGSSEIATIMGLNPYETKYQLWRRKLGIDPPKEETFLMKAGHYLEDAISLFWQDETGRKIIKRSAGDWIIKNAEKPFLQVSPDRTYWVDPNGKENRENKGILECKSTQMQIDESDLPKYWFCQVQYQLGVAEAENGSLAWLTSGREFGYKDIMFVPDFYQWMLEEADKFWTDNIIGGKEPELESVKDVLTKYSKHMPGKVIDLTDEQFDKYLDLKDVRAEIKALEKRKSELEKDIKLIFGDAEAVQFDGKICCTWKASRASERFDAKAFTEENPELAKKYTKTVQGDRRFLVK